MRARYRIVEPLGHGTRVFRGVAESSDGPTRDVVITQVFASPPENPKLAAMCLDDWRASASLRHTNIVDTVDVAKTPEGAYFAVTEYVAGCDLKTFASRRKRISPADALYIIVECCKGLAHAHSLDVIHRDVSPRTVLLGTRGEVKLMDFGLAKANSLLESNDPGIANDKFSYLSPEAASGSSVDHRADVFGLGIVLWELLAGRRLFLGQTDHQSVELIREARVPAIEGLDPTLDALLHKALARDAALRFQTARELGEALGGYAVSQAFGLAWGEIGKLVGDVKLGVDFERQAKRIDRESFARMQERVSSMVSILDVSTQGTSARN